MRVVAVKEDENLRFLMVSLRRVPALEKGHLIYTPWILSCLKKSFT